MSINRIVCKFFCVPYRRIICSLQIILEAKYYINLITHQFWVIRKIFTRISAWEDRQTNRMHKYFLTESIKKRKSKSLPKQYFLMDVEESKNTYVGVLYNLPYQIFTEKWRRGQTKLKYTWRISIYYLQILIQ